MLRRPLGHYRVGTWYLDTGEIGDKPFRRKLSIMVFYPSDEVGTVCTYKTKEYLHTYVEGHPKENGICTHCFDHVPLSNKKEQYPVIICSHGWNGYLMENTVLCADLASCGYIVFCVGHPYGAEIVTYTDGTSFEGWQEIMGKDEKTGSLEYIKLILKAAPVRSYQRRNESWRKYCSNYRKVMGKLGQMWEEDIKAAMDYIEQIASGKIQTIFARRLQLEKGMGIMGMSFGGCCSLGIALKEERAAYGINLDGALFYDLKPSDLKKPLLVLHQPINIYAYLMLKALKCKNVTIKTIKGLNHWQFADGVYLSEKGKKNPEWAALKSKEKTLAILEFIQRLA